MYLHSEVKSLERMELIRNLRLGEYDILVGINLLREGLDLPEVSFIGILDADKEGFLRSTRSLIQTIGRAARNVNGKVVMYADHITDSMRNAIEETNRRRTIQLEYNHTHQITPKTISKPIHESLSVKIADMTDDTPKKMTREEIENSIAILEKQMLLSAKELDFERAAELRDIIMELKKK
jgi:excinuclease ABC subunit B